MEVLTIDWNLLEELSYQTHLEKSLKNTLRKFNKEELFDEINEIISFLLEKEDTIIWENRIKSIHSCNLKYQKYFPSTPVEKTFNDILGIRIIVDKYTSIETLNLPKCVKYVDLSNGKSIDDGYRAIHLYYQPDHFHYPIEIQLMTHADKVFNEWLHTYIYKYTKDTSIGANLRLKYECGEIQNEEDFRKEMQKLCVT